MTAVAQRTSPPRARAAALLVVAAAAALAIAVMSLSGGRAPTPAEQAHTAAERFLDRYMAADGRVVRRDQGGDTVSEGQAYGMLLAVAAGDRERFDAAWRWTRTHLQRRDGALAWHWSRGRVVGSEPATDADLDAAHALLLGARRFREPQLRTSAARIGRAVLAAETVAGRDGPVLVAGPWARAQRVVNPSYFAPRAFAALHSLTGDERWAQVAASSRRVVAALVGQSGLPPDWARLGGPAAVPAAPPGRAGPAAYGYDAARVAVRYAASCDPADRALAARMWPRLRVRPGVPVRGLDGKPRAGGAHPVAFVAAAAAARAAGARAKARELLGRAAALDEARPSYYGAAWVALGRAMLTTSLLGRCGRG